MSGLTPGDAMLDRFFEADMADPIVIALEAGCIGVYTHRAPGKETVNEDSAAVIDCGPGCTVLAVADGAGGFRAGERASQIALESVENAVHQAVQGRESLRDAVLNGIEEANRRVLDLGLGAATTLVVAEIQGGNIRTYHVGDSMGLVVGQRGRLKLQTVSHSPVGYAVESGMLDAGEAMDHEHRHLVSNFIGTPDMRVEIGSMLELGQRDTVLLASDGLFDNLHIEEIVEHVRCGPPGPALRSLVERTRQRMEGGDPAQPSKPDDLTALVFRATGACR